ncbi:ATPase [Streptomyces sp. A012304]|nr:ATPase [Streptomyces sp. A012304]
MIPSARLGTDAAAGRPQGLGAAAGTGLDQTVPERRFRFELAAHPGSPAQARRLARARLTGWSVCEDTCDTAALVISELVTNAIVHTASGVVVCELIDGDDLVRIAVRDEGCAPGEPHPSPQRPEEEHGRGLFLVDALCRSWGAQEHGPGLLVWADLPRHPDTAPTESYDVRDIPCVPGLPGPPGLPAAPRDDLGWGARPKPGPAGGSGEEDETGEREHMGLGSTGHLTGRRPHPAPTAPLSRVVPQRQHGAQTGGRSPSDHLPAPLSVHPPRRDPGRGPA